MTERVSSDPVIITGGADPALAREVATLSNVKFEEIKVGKFADGEIMLDLGNQLHKKDVIIIQSTSPPVNDNLVELLLMISTAKRAGAKYVTAVIPYFGYSRQTDKTTPGSPISCSDVARMLESMGVDRVVLLDIHSVITQGFFTSSYTDMYGSEALSVDYFVGLGLKNVAVVSPDAGAIKRTMKFLDLYNTRTGSDCEMVFVAKVRPEANVVASTTVIGNVKDKNIIIVDDMIDTAGTIVKLADTLKQHGANDIYAFATHGLLSGPAAERILQSEFKQVAVTDTIKQPKRILEHPKIKVVPIAQLLSKIVKETLI